MRYEAENNGEVKRVEQNDSSIIKDCLSGNKNAYEILVLRYQSRVYNLSYRLVGNTEDARDIAQEAFVKAYQSLNKHNPDYSFGGWILRITHNLSIDHLRKKTRRPMVSINRTESQYSDDDNSSSTWEIKDTTPNARELLSEKEKKEYLEKMIQSLPENYRAILVLRHTEQMELNNIAQMLNIPIGTVKTNLFRARQLLKEKMVNVL